jgi:DNA-binding transcriptional ArsR family regulator
MSGSPKAADARRRPQMSIVETGSRNLDRTLAALADPYRRQVVDLLRERPHRAGELAEATQIAFPLMSRHLKTLRESGLVEEDRDEFDSRVRIYRLRPEPMADLRVWLEETEALWGRQLLALKAHLAKGRK